MVKYLALRPAVPCIGPAAGRTSNRKMIGHFSIQQHHFSGANPQSFCVLIENSGVQMAYRLVFAVLCRHTDHHLLASKDTHRHHDCKIPNNLSETKETPLGQSNQAVAVE